MRGVRVCGIDGRATRRCAPSPIARVRALRVAAGKRERERAASQTSQTQPDANELRNRRPLLRRRPRGAAHSRAEHPRLRLLQRLRRRDRRHRRPSRQRRHALHLHAVRVWAPRRVRRLRQDQVQDCRKRRDAPRRRRRLPPQVPRRRRRLPLQWRVAPAQDAGMHHRPQQRRQVHRQGARRHARSRAPRPARRRGGPGAARRRRSAGAARRRRFRLRLGRRRRRPSRSRKRLLRAAPALLRRRAAPGPPRRRAGRGARDRACRRAPWRWTWRRC